MTIKSPSSARGHRARLRTLAQHEVQNPVLSLARTFWPSQQAGCHAGRVLAGVAVAATGLAIAAPATVVRADENAVAIVTTIKPIHGIISAITRGVAQPTLLLDGPQSPHSFTLKPSQAEALQHADVIFLIDPELEVPVGRIARSLPESVRLVPLIEVPGITTLKLRTGVAFERHRRPHGHGKSGDASATHQHQGEHAHHGDHDHDHDKQGARDAKHEHHEHGEAAEKVRALPDQDPHLWLDPENARAMAVHATELLSARFPKHEAAFKANLADFGKQLDVLKTDLKAKLAPAAGKSYIVFHDAYQYFERRFGLQAAGAISVSPEVPPGAKRLSELRQRVKSANAVCVFSEPQFQARVIDTVIEGSDARKGVVDPLGIDVPAGPDFYPAFLRRLADSFVGCLVRS